MRNHTSKSLAAIAAVVVSLSTAVILGGAKELLVAAPVSPNTAAQSAADASDPHAPDPKTLPALDGAAVWLNSAPLDAAALKGHVVIVDFWTFLCSNCQAALPFVRKLDADFRGKGLITIGVHTPELAPERDLNNVKKAIVRLGVTYPVPVDPDFIIWNRFNNRYWPSIYIFDKTGKLRYHWDGEGDYAAQRVLVQQLLAE